MVHLQNGSFWLEGHSEYKRLLALFLCFLSFWITACTYDQPVAPTLRREVAIHGADDKSAVKRYFNKSGSSWDLLCNSVLQTRFSNSLNKNWTPEMLQGSIVFSLHCAVFSSTCHKQGSHKETVFCFAAHHVYPLGHPWCTLVSTSFEQEQLAPSQNIL